MTSQTVNFYRTLFLSDLHIGAKSFDAEAFLDFLKKHECETLYLVGDIIDGWKMKKRWLWSETISAIFDELIRKAHNGTKIIYVPGNHDEAVRFLPLHRRLRFAKRYSIQIKNKIIHETLSGKKLLVLHGDQFDHKIIDGPISRLCDRMYDTIMELTGAYQERHGSKKNKWNPAQYISRVFSYAYQSCDSLLAAIGLYDRHRTIVIDGEERPFSLVKFIASQGQYAMDVLNNFEKMLVNTAQEEDAHGIICGHTHVAALKHVQGILYGNCGSWLRGLHTALAEDEHGELQLIKWPNYKDAAPQTELALNDIPVTEPVACYRPMTEKLIGSIQLTFTNKAKRPATMPEKTTPPGITATWPSVSFRHLA